MLRGMTPRRALLLAPLATPAFAQAPWPNRPVRVINPYAPGGTTDIIMRLMAERLERALGQPFIIESRGGAGGAIGTAAGAQATDGHTLVVTNTGPLSVAPALPNPPPYDPARAFTYITMFGGAPILIAVRNAAPINTVADYIAAARARAEAMSYGTSGVGSIGHLAGLVFEGATGTRMLHIPFRGASEAEVAVLGGEPVSLVNTLGAHAGAVRQGGLRGLAVTSAERVPSFPNIPTLVESGLAGAVVTNWFLLAGPASMPAEYAARINAVCQAAMAEPAVAERFAQMGLVSLGNLSGAQIRDFVAAEAARWAPLVRQAGITG